MSDVRATAQRGGAALAVPDGRDEAKRHRRGTHRLVAPEETWERIAPKLPAFGITRVADVTGLDEVGIPVFQAVRPEGHVVAVSQGKGITPALARVSAAMESIEAWHAERERPAVAHGPARVIGPLPYAVQDLPLAPRSLVSDDLVVDWLEATALVSGRTVLVPRRCVMVSKLAQPGWDPPTFDMTSNGLGSGNSLTEAALHALCEVVEGDCLTRVASVPRAQRDRVALESVDDPVCIALLEQLTATGNAIEVFELSGELAVPCFMASIVSDVLPRRFSGAGCHPDAGVALSRALTEAAQVRLVAIAGARDDLADVIYDQHWSPGPPRLVSGPGTVPFRQTASFATDSLDRDLSLVARRVHDYTGVEPLLVDLSHPEHRIPVVRVVAPRLACRLEQLGFREAA